MRPYLKTLILFPLILLFLAAALLWGLDDASDGLALSATPYFSTAFFFAALPAFLIALLAAKFRYARYHIASIVLISALIGLIYCNLASYFYLLLQGTQDSTFWQWLSGGGLSLGLISACGLVFYSLFVLPWLLPKTR